jgi:hypothetical protein
MTNKPKPRDLAQILTEGATLDELKIKGPEDPEDQRLRRRKDFLLFLVKDVLAYLVAFTFIIAMAIYSFVVLIKHGATSEEAQKVWPIVSAILAGIVGMVFGRATK